jgi:hypothetical protein
MASDDETDVPS